MGQTPSTHGIKRLQYVDGNTNASDPGRIELDLHMLKLLRPDLFATDCCSGRMNKHNRDEIEQIQQHVMYGDSRAAMVVCLKPLLIAAYSDEMDAVAMLSMPQWLCARNKHNLELRSRLLTVNLYKRAADGNFQEDLQMGSGYMGRWTGFYPIIADFVTKDEQRLRQRKAEIGEDEWDKTWHSGMKYLKSLPGLARDGQPRAVGPPDSVHYDQRVLMRTMRHEIGT